MNKELHKINFNELISNLPNNNSKAEKAFEHFRRGLEDPYFLSKLTKVRQIYKSQFSIFDKSCFFLSLSISFNSLFFILTSLLLLFYFV